jgi:hypothetical protein
MRSVDMPPIGTVEEAIITGETFVRRYYRFLTPLEAKKEGDVWRVVFNVGVLRQQLVKLSIDANSGSITEYTAPEDV